VADPINLRQARKAKARSAKEQTAAQNRIAFGLSKAVKSIGKAKTELEAARLNGARLVKGGDHEPS
jgi:hypothetical protein